MNQVLAGLQRLRTLRIMLKSCDREITRQRKMPLSMQSDLAQEEALARHLRREIQKQERWLFDSEFGFI